MASTSETGHAKNVATFEDLISFCAGNGTAYNPSKNAIKLTELRTQLVGANTILDKVKAAKTDYDNDTNARELGFSPLKKLATKIMNALGATDATRQTIDDARSSNLKIQGRRAKAVAQPTPGMAGAEPVVVKTASISQQSFDKMIDHFAQLIATLKAEPLYLPNESYLSVAGLTATLNDLRMKNTNVINSYTALSNARIARDNYLYAKKTGIIDTSLSVKKYLVSVFGTSSPQYKQVSKLQFVSRKSR